MVSNQALWKKISDYSLDHLMVNDGFKKKLIQKNSWSNKMTQNAIIEYKKFIYLAAIHSKVVSPSNMVDLVWHEHLLFTKDYWQNFIPIVGKQIHHSPSDGSNAEVFLLKQCYLETIELYQLEFGKMPSPKLWPTPKTSNTGELVGLKNWITSFGFKLTLGVALSVFPISQLSSSPVKHSVVMASVVQAPEFILSIRSFLFEHWTFVTLALLAFALAIYFLLFGFKSDFRFGFNPNDTKEAREKRKNNSFFSGSCGGGCGGD